MDVIKLIIIDRGIGIPPNALNKILIPFSQLKIPMMEDHLVA